MNAATKFLRNIFNEVGINKCSEISVDDLESCLRECCRTISAKQFFSAKALKSASNDDLLYTLRVLVDYGFVIEWLFGMNSFCVGTDVSRETEYVVAETNVSATVYFKARVPELPSDTDLREADYDRIVERAKLGMGIFTKLLEFLNSNKDYVVIKYNVCVFSVLLCLEHLKKTKWSDESSINSGNKLLELVLHVNSASLQEFLSKPSEWRPDVRCYDDAFETLQPSLGTTNWKRNPAVTNAFATLVENIKFPHMSECLTHVLPPTLLFLDDFEEENASLGHDCLNFVLVDATRSELKRFGRAEVVFDCLLNQLNVKNDFIFEKLLTNLCLVLRIVETSPSLLLDVAKEKKCDKVLGIILKNMLMENEITLRRVYCRFLAEFLQMLGLSSLKHVKLILEVITSYLERRDDECREKMLESLLLLVGSCWPRMDRHALDVVRTLLRLLHELSRSRCDANEASREKQLELISSCLQTLNRIVPEVKTCINSVLDLNLGGEFDSSLRNAFA